MFVFFYDSKFLSFFYGFDCILSLILDMKLPMTDVFGGPDGADIFIENMLPVFIFDFLALKLLLARENVLSYMNDFLARCWLFID